MIYFLLFGIGLVAFALSTIAGGGGALIVVAVLGGFLPANKIAPVVQLGNFIGRPSRVWVFREFIRWDIVKWYLPFAIVGAFIGAYFFTRLNAEWVLPVIAVFLITTPVQFRFGKKKQAFKMSVFAFAPLGFLVSFVSSLVGATGMVLNPFYLNFGVTKEELIATKAVNSFIVGMVQVSTYASFGLLSGKYFYFGLCIGLGAIFGNLIGKFWLSNISDKRFLQLVILVMFISGCVMLFRLIASYVQN